MNKVTIGPSEQDKIRIEEVATGELFYGQVTNVPHIRTDSGSVRLNDGQEFSVSNFYTSNRDGRVRLIKSAITIQSIK